jgi:integrase
MAGTDRAVLYQVALCTGFRRKELASLAPESFNLDDTPPNIVVAAAHSKRRREDRQPIPHALADVLRQWLPSKPPGKPVFPLPYWTAKMLRQDLAAAGIAEETAEGVFDLHATRHTYITKLALSIIPVPIAQ